MEQPKVIIYMSCYNHESYVKESLDSIINQTYQNWELYIVNDGSADNTGKIIETYTDPRIFYYDFKENTAFIGAADFLQNLVRNIEGKYIATSSSDDKWELDKLEKQVEILEKHPEYKCCFTWDKILLDDENDLYYKDHREYSHKNNRSRYDWLRLFFEEGNCLNACSMLMKKEIFYELGRMNEHYRLLGDFRLWLFLAAKYQFYVLEEEKTYYRRHNANLSKVTRETIVKNETEFFYIYSQLFKMIDKKTFIRTFYCDLPYETINSEEEFEAAKFILLLNTYVRVKEQVAISLYFENCENEKFLKILEEKYNFKANNFMCLTENGGMVYSLLDIVNGERQSFDDGSRFTPAYILLNKLSELSLKETDIYCFRYNTLADLGEVLQWGKDFFTIKTKLEDIRNKKEKNNIAVLIGEETDFTIEEIKAIVGADTECYVSVLPTKKSMYLDEKSKGIFLYEESDNMKEIELYDGTEHCLKFLDEVGIAPDIIYYVDCLDERYNCQDMMQGYSLAAEQNAVIRRRINEQKPNWMNLMTHVYER